MKIEPQKGTSSGRAKQVNLRRDLPLQVVAALGGRCQTRTSIESHFPRAEEQVLAAVETREGSAG